MAAAVVAVATQGARVARVVSVRAVVVAVRREERLFSAEVWEVQQEEEGQAAAAAQQWAARFLFKRVHNW
jgi:hypothetical protein